MLPAHLSKSSGTRPNPLSAQRTRAAASRTEAARDSRMANCRMRCWYAGRDCHCSSADASEKMMSLKALPMARRWNSSNSGVGMPSIMFHRSSGCDAVKSILRRRRGEMIATIESRFA